MKNRWLRIIIAVVTAEVIPIILLIAIIAVFSTGNAVADQDLAKSIGVWIGPLGGAAATFLMAYWALRPLSVNHLGFGALIGGLVASLDWSILAASGEGFQWLFFASGVGRLIAGIAAGAAAAGK